MMICSDQLKITINRRQDEISVLGHKISHLSHHSQQIKLFVFATTKLNINIFTQLLNFKYPNNWFNTLFSVEQYHL